MTSTPQAVRRSVLFVTNDFPPRRGGIESFVLALARGLDPADVIVYTASMPGWAEEDTRLPFPVYRDPARTLLPTRAVGRRVAAVLARHGCDRVVFGASAPLGLLSPRLRRAGARRIVALTHGHEAFWARLPITRRLLRRIGDDVDVLTYVSGWSRDAIVPALSPEARGRMRRLSPGVDPERFHPGCGGADVRRRWGIAQGAPVVVCTARLVARKGQDTLVRAWPDVLRAHPDAVLLLVGDGPAHRRLQRLVASYGVTGSVLFTGAVPWDEVPAYTDAGDVFAMPCRTRRLGLEAEAWGIVLLEARACGLDVVVGRSGGAPEAAGPVATAVVGVGETEEALTRSLTAVCRDRSRCAPSTESTWTAAVDQLARWLGVTETSAAARLGSAGQRGAGLLEQAARLASDELDRTDDHHRDERGQQGVLD